MMVRLCLHTLFYWVARDNDCFRPTLTTLKLTFT